MRSHPSISARARGAAAVAVAAALLLTGCGLVPRPSMPPVPTAEPAPSASGSADDGSQAAQCARLMAQISTIGTDLARVPELLGTDIFGAVQLLGSISTRVGDLQTRISDPALLERIGEIQAGWDAIVADAEASIQAGDAAGIERATTALAELGDQVVALQEFCAGTA